MDCLAIVIPCKDESALLRGSLASLGRAIGYLAQLSPDIAVRVVLVDDNSADGSRAIAEDLESTVGWLAVMTSSGAGEAAARTAGTEYAFDRFGSADWVIACDVDQTYESTWLASWIDAIAEASLGAIGGRDRIAATSAQRHPECAIVLTELEQLANRIESIVGVTNLNGHNHAISRRSYEEAGPYQQAYRSLAPGEPPVPIAGADWDLGVRLRRLGHPLSFVQNPTIYSGRRFHEAPLDYVSGQTYNREFGTRGRDYIGGENASPTRHTSEDIMAARTLGVRKALLHYLAKPLIVEPELIRDPCLGVALGQPLQEAVATWLASHPVADFDEDRDDTLLRAGPDLVGTFYAELCAALDTPIEPTGLDTRP